MLFNKLFNKKDEDEGEIFEMKQNFLIQKLQITTDI